MFSGLLLEQGEQGMTKEELEKEAEELYEDWYAHKLGAISIIDVICKMAEPRERQIELDAEQIRALQKQNGELTDKVKELEAIVKNTKAVDESFAKLQQENAELKLFKQDCVRLTEDNVVMSRQRAETARQLTKAKHYIKELARAVEHSYSVLSWQRPPIKTEAEQFLSEVEK